MWRVADNDARDCGSAALIARLDHAIGSERLWKQCRMGSESVSATL